jgi:hypothetical protein
MTAEGGEGEGKGRGGRRRTGSRREECSTGTLIDVL